LGHFACCIGDTWASEIGVLNPSDPILITSFKKVPKGTNGGITILGLACSFVGGLFLGLSAFFWDYLKCQRTTNFFWFLVIGTCGGGIGSIIDSLLGATLQRTMFNTKTQQITDNAVNHKHLIHISGIDLLDNHQVNLVSSLLTSVTVFAISYLSTF
jgi:uncharacterized protein (TIGR00297 family)